jgi:hypothetical protein
MKKPTPPRFSCEACHRPTPALWDMFHKETRRIQSVCADCTTTLVPRGWRRLRHDSAGQVDPVQATIRGGETDRRVKAALTALPPGDRE